MKKQHILIFFALFISILSFNACKDDHDEADTAAPELMIESPAENASIRGAVDIHIHVTDESLHEMEVKVTNDSDGVVVFEDAPVIHDETDYHYETTFTPSGLTGDTPMTLTVKVEDHSGHSTTKTVKFTAAP